MLPESPLAFAIGPINQDEFEFCNDIGGPSGYRTVNGGGYVMWPDAFGNIRKSVYGPSVWKHIRANAINNPPWRRAPNTSSLNDEANSPTDVRFAYEHTAASPDWMIPRLPERLRNLAQRLIASGGRMGCDELKKAIRFDPSRIYHDYKTKRLTDWISKYIDVESRGVYCWLGSMESAPKVSQSLLKTNM